MKSCALLFTLVLGSLGYGANAVETNESLTSAKVACHDYYTQTSEEIRRQLGPEDTAIAPGVDAFLASYDDHLVHFPSWTDLEAKAKERGISGDVQAEYNRKQELAANRDKFYFVGLLLNFKMLEEAAAGDANGSIGPYAKCLRSYMLETIAKMPEESNYILKKSDLLQLVPH